MSTLDSYTSLEEQTKSVETSIVDGFWNLIIRPPEQQWP
jgi:hypothetical protein